MSEIVYRYAPTYDVDIYIAGDIEVAKQTCRKFCDRGACVTVLPLDYIYTYGEESGMKIGFINYPRFSKPPEQIFDQAVELGHQLMEDLHQGSFTIVERDRSHFYSRREVDK